MENVGFLPNFLVSFSAVRISVVLEFLFRFQIDRLAVDAVCEEGDRHGKKAEKMNANSPTKSTQSHTITDTRTQTQSPTRPTHSNSNRKLETNAKKLRTEEGSENSSVCSARPPIHPLDVLNEMGGWWKLIGDKWSEIESTTTNRRNRIGGSKVCSD